MKKISLIFILLISSAMASEWKYFTDNDYGIRNDKYGRGDFKAPRGGWTRKHTGIDYLLDYGTNLYSPCDGEVKWSFVKAFGYSIDIVCASPIEKIQDIYFSIRFAHVDETSPFVKENKKKKFYKVTAGELVGYVGASGNASGTKPHVHLEISVHENVNSAKSAAHSLQDQEPSIIAKELINKLKEECEMDILDSRIDPYLLFKCLEIQPKDLLEHPQQEDSLYPKAYLWKSHY